MHGVVDVDGLQIPERELMGHALMNSIEITSIMISRKDTSTEGEVAM